MQDNVPITSAPGRHSWAELLALIDELRRLAYDQSLDDADRAGRTSQACAGPYTRGRTQLLLAPTAVRDGSYMVTRHARQ